MQKSPLSVFVQILCCILILVIATLASDCSGQTILSEEMFPYCIDSPFPHFPVTVTHNKQVIKQNAVVTCSEFASVSGDAANLIAPTIRDFREGRGILGLNLLNSPIIVAKPFATINEVIFTKKSSLSYLDKRYDIFIQGKTYANSNLVLDPSNQMLIFQHLDTALPSKDMSPSVHITIGHQRLKFKVDLTLPIAVRLSNRTAAMIKDNFPNNLEEIDISSAFSDVGVFRLNSVSIEETNIPHLYCEIRGVEDLIGVQALNRFKTILNFSSESVRLMPRDAIYVDHSVLDGFAISSKVSEDGLNYVVVDKVLPGSIAAASGFEAQDKLLGIEGKDLRDPTVTTISTLLHKIMTPRKIPLVFKVMRRGAEIEIGLGGTE